MPEVKKSEINLRIIEGASFRKISAEERTVEFVASDNSVDSYGTVLPVDGWDLRRYEKNGIVGYMHEVYGGGFNSSDPDDIIGRGEAFVEDGQLIVRVTFEPAELNPKADKIFRKIQFGSIKGVSVGFRPTADGHWGNEERGENPDVYYYAGQELLEVSVVNIPSNENAVKRSMDLEQEALPQKPEKRDAEPEPVKEEKEETLNISLTSARARSLLAKR